jgi:hypothetical protein
VADPRGHSELSVVGAVLCDQIWGTLGADDEGAIHSSDGADGPDSRLWQRHQRGNELGAGDPWYDSAHRDPGARVDGHCRLAVVAAATAVDAAYATWGGAILGVTQVSALLAPAAAYVTALTTFDTAIQGIGIGGVAATDIAALVTDDRAIIADLQALSTASSITQWRTQISADGAKAITAGDTARAALGLPPS